MGGETEGGKWVAREQPSVLIPPRKRFITAHYMFLIQRNLGETENIGPKRFKRESGVIKTTEEICKEMHVVSSHKRKLGNTVNTRGQ